MISKYGEDMNKTKVATYDKIMLPLRLPPDLYQKVVEKVQNEKKDVRGYSINQYITELIEKNLKEKNNG